MSASGAANNNNSNEKSPPPPPFPPLVTTPGPPAPLPPGLVTHAGACHCGAIAFEVDRPAHLARRPVQLLPLLARRRAPSPFVPAAAPLPP
jgi:hypothetical protein